jgi:Ca2+-binding RTX toxin-like protein
LQVALPLEPLSLAGLRTRNMRYWIVALCLGAFLSAYVSPMILALSQGDRPTFSLPRLELAVLGFPALKVPDVGLPAKAKDRPVVSSRGASAPSTAAPARAAQQARRTAQPVQVVTSTYVLTAPEKQAPKRTAAPADPFANVPVVESSVGALPPQTHPLMAASAPPEGEEDTTALTQAELDAAVAQAASEWGADVSGVTFTVADLPDLLLGQTSGTSIRVDTNAAGWGWAQMNLLTVVRHEIGHYLGRDHGEGGVMSETLAPGESHGVPAPEPPVVTAPSSVDLGSAKVGTSASATVTVSNAGSSSVDVTGIAVTSGSSFAIVGPATPTTIAASATLDISVSFAPLSAGAAAASLTIEGSMGSLTVDLSGLGTAPELVAPASADLGDVMIGATATQTIELANTGDAELAISDLTIVDDAGGDFAITSPVPATIAPGGSASITVSLTPNTAGVKSARLVVASDNPGGDVEVTLAGRATAWLVGGGTARAPPVDGLALDHTLVFDAGTASLVQGGTSDTISLAGISLIEILGGALDDSLTITGALPVAVHFDGGSGNDTLGGPSSDTTWTVTGAGAGALSGGVTFAGTENLVGAAGNRDSFVFEAGGSIAGTVDGGAGGDDVLTLAAGTFATTAFSFTGPDSGSIARDGQVITYVALEPITDATGGAKVVSAAVVTISNPGGTNDNSFLVVIDPGEDITFSNASAITSLTINGTAAADVITINAADQQFTAPITITGSAGNDRYVFGNGFGNVTLSGADADTDTLDFTNYTAALTLNDTRTSFTSTGGTVTQPAAPNQAEEIDVSIAALVDLKTKLNEVLDKLEDWVEGATALAHAIQNVLPLLSPDAEGSLDKILKPLDAVAAFVTSAKAAITAASLPKLSDLITALNAAAYTGLFAGVTFSTNYRGEGTQSDPAAASGPLEVFVKINRPETTVAKSIPLNLGSVAESLGISIDANPALAGIQVPTVSVTGKFAALLEIGTTTAAGTPIVFLRPGGFLTLGLTASLPLTGLAIDVSFLHTTVTTGSLSLAGSVNVTLTDLTPTDGRITVSDFTTGPLSSLFTITEPVTPTFTGSATVNVAAGVRVVDTTTVDLVTATFGASVTGGIFGTSTEPAKINVTFTAAPSATVINLLDSFNNAGPNDILSMLQAIANAFTAIAGSEILNVEIPFTGKTLGDALAYGTAFKEKILDPLFVSGDLLRPDNDGDGDIDLSDLNFSSIQSLLDRIETALGIGDVLQALYEPISKELKFTFNLTKALGFGEVKAVETRRGGSLAAPDEDEKQTITVNGVATLGVADIGDTWRLAFPDANGALEFTTPINLGATAGAVELALEALSMFAAADIAVTSGGTNIYVITFDGAYSNTNVGLLSTDASDLAGSFSLNFGAELGDLASISTSGSFTLLATLSAGLTFVLDLTASQEIEVTPAVYSPAIDLRAEVPAGATNNVTQIITVANVNGGTYDLALDLDSNGTIGVGELVTVDYNETAAALDLLLEPLTGVDTTVSLAQFGNLRIYTVTFTSPASPPRLIADPTNLTGPSTNGKLTGNAVFTVDVIHPDIQVSDGDPLHTAQTITGSTVISGLSVTALKTATDANSSLADLGADVASAVNSALATGGHTPGWVTAGKLSTGAVGAGGMATAGHNPLTSTKTDIAFTIVLKLNGGTTEKKVTARVRAVDLLDVDASGSLFNANGTLNLTELADTFTAAELATQLQDAIADALANAGVSGFTFTVTVVGSTLRLSVTAVPTASDTMELLFVPSVQVDAGGGRISVSSPPVTFSPHALLPGTTVDRLARPATSGFSTVAYQELGLQSAPTRYDGSTSTSIQFTMIVNGSAPIPVSLGTGAHGGDLAGLVSALNGVISTALTTAGLGSDDVVAELIDPLGNRIRLVSEGGIVSSFAVQVPLDIDSGTAGIQLNGAITELGLSSGPGETRRALATEFYLENTSLSGTFQILVPSVTLTATFGFLGVSATGSGTLPIGPGTGELLSVSASLALKSPVDGSNRVSLTQIAGALAQGFFLFGTPGGTDETPATGFVQGTISGGFGVKVTFSVSGLSGLSGLLNAFLEVSASSPDWLLSPPTFDDPLGFGADLRAITGTPTVLGAVPTDGVLAADVRFVVNDGAGNEAVGFLVAGDYGSSAGDIVAALQTAFNDALARLPGVQSATVGLSGGNLSLTGNGFSVRGNLFHVNFDGPDVAAILDRFKDLSFSDVIQGLQMLIDFLRSMQGTAGGSAVALILDTKLPLIDRSVSELVDLAAELGGRIDALLANPAGSLQLLENEIRAALGLGTGPPILSWDPTNSVVNFDFNFGESVSVSRPFSLSLADAPLPDFLTSIVGVSASGTLTANASLTLQLKLGLDLSGTDTGFFLKTGSTGTKLVASATATGSNLAFEARLGPFGLFVQNGSAGAGAGIEVRLVDADSDGRLYIFPLPGSSATTDLGHLGDFVDPGDFVGSGSIIVTQTGPGGAFAAATLPLYVGTADANVPIDFGTDNPGAPEPSVTDPPWPTGPDHAIRVEIDLLALLQGGDAFDFQVPDFDFNNFEIPSLFALLSDPAVIIDGLDRLLLVLQDALSGQIFGQKLPFVGDLLKDNPAANVLRDIREKLLQPLAQTLRENNATLATLVGLIQQQVVNILGPGGPIATALGLASLIKDRIGSAPGIGIDDIFQTGVNLANPLDTTPYLQFDFDLEWSKTISAAPIKFDLGIPVLGIEGELQPNVTINFALHFGFGVHEDHGLYFVTDADPELSLGISVGFSAIACPAGTVTRAHVDGRLLFLALKIKDGVDLDGDTTVEVNCGNVTNPKTEELSKLFLTGTVDIDDPNADGMLTLAEMVSGSFRDIVKPSLIGGAVLRTEITVDFSTLSPEVARALPKVTAALLIDFVINVNTSVGFQVGAPGVAIANITLDLGEFISKFAAPILNGIKEVLDPLEWLIGPDGFLNKRIPLLSDLAGRTITGKDLILLFDQEHGPSVVAFLDFVEGLYNLINLVNRAAADGTVTIGFGDLVLSNSSYYSSGFPIIDQEIGFSLPGITDLRRAPSLSTGSLSIPAGDPFAAVPANKQATKSFTAGVREPGGFRFLLLEPENLLGLFMGKPVKIFEVDFPVLGFDFFYRQEFPIIGPLVGTFAGGVGAQLKMGFGYDTFGIQKFIESGNPGALLEGFYLIDYPEPEATLTATIAVGAALSVVIFKVGVEGGITATINFDIADLDGDGRVRFKEIAENLIANDFNPLAIFDISGYLEFFLRAYIEINLFITKITLTFEFARLRLFEFEIDFNRPAILANNSGGVLTLHIGPSAGQRLNGNVDDIGETIHVESDGSGNILVWSDQFDRPQSIAMEFSGVTKIFADGGSSNDTIDLSGVGSDACGIVIEIHGGLGNDTIDGSDCDDQLFGDEGNDTLRGHDGEDILRGGDGEDHLLGGDGNDELFGDAGNDPELNGEGDDDEIQGGAGNDTYIRSDGADTYELFDFGSDETISGTGADGDTLDFAGMAVNLTLFLTTTTIDIGWQQTPATAGTAIGHFEHRLHVLDSTLITLIIGGSFVDTFHVTGTAGAITLDGDKGNDVYNFYTGSSAITATVTDTGDPWNSGDIIKVIDGASPFDSTQDDTITITSSTLTINAAATQVVTYTAPAATDNVVSIKIDSRVGDDLITVASTHANVPVRIESGSGNDKVVVGSSTVNSIAGLSRPGLNAPFGVGPLVVVGGSGGTDVLVIDDSGDGTGDTGTLTAWKEKREGVTNPVEVGVVSGFGMTMIEDLGTGDGRVEFEGIEILELKLGSGADTVWVGGDTLFGTLLGDLPQNRQDVVTEFVHSPQAMKAILTGGGNDDVNIVSTALIPNRDTFSTGLGLVSTGGANLSQTLTISSAARGHGYFTLKLRYEETAPIPLNATAAQIEAELDKLLLVGNASNVSVSVFDSDTFTITFSPTLVSVEQLVARIVPLLVNTQGGEDEIRAQALYEESFIQGGASSDHIWVNVNATTGLPLTYNEIVPDVLISTTQGGTALQNEIQQIFLQDVTGGTFTLSQGLNTTGPIAWDAPAATVRRALENFLGTGNVTVVRTAPNTYLVEFVGSLEDTNVDQLTANASALRSNGVHAIVTVDGENATDLYDVYLIGQDTDSLVNVFDTGASGTDQLITYGTDETFTPDTFLLRASTSDKGLAFIALINAPDPFAVQPGDPIERVNYNENLELITVEGREGDDSFYIDDTRAQIVINAGQGNDFFQVGQLYQSRRTPELAGVAPEDVFATIETTRGWLSNGISDQMTINGDDGEDEFIVFHNIATLVLRGGADDDSFLVQAFALIGSTNPVRGLTDLAGDAGADSVLYAVNAPVHIDGGDGFDTVTVIGTEFPDDFVVTKNGVFGAGLNVNFVNIEFLEVDGAEGDDRFFILSTGIGFTTIITGGLGTDLFSVQGPTPGNGVISNDLLGHSGIVTHSVEGTLAESEWSGLKVVGVATNVQDNDEPSVIVTQTNGYSQVVQGASLTELAQGIDTFTVVLGRPTLLGETVRIEIAPVPGLVFLDSGLNELLALGQPDGLALDFTDTNWWIPQTVRFKVWDGFVGEMPDLADIGLGVTTVGGTGTITGTVQVAGSFAGTHANCTAVGGNACATMTTGDATFPVAGPSLPQGIRGATLKITAGDDEAAGQLRLILANTANSLTLNTPWSVEPSPGAIFEISLFAAVQLPIVHVKLFSGDHPSIVVDESEGSTSVAEGAGASGEDTIRVRLSSEVTSGTVTVALGGGGQLSFWDGLTQVTSIAFTSANWNTFKTLTVKAIDDLVVEGFHKADLTLTASGTTAYNGVTALTITDLADDEWPGVRVLESNGSTNVIEFDAVNHGVSEATAVAAGFPKSDTYQIVLTKAPAATDPVTITVRAEPTRTTRTGGIVSFIEQNKVCVIGPSTCTSAADFAFSKDVTFTSTDWSTPRTVVVWALDDARVDGMDTQVFAPQLDLLNNIQGPLFIRGGLGEDRTGLFEREPVMLPGEFNQRPSMGDVVSATEAVATTPATITIDPSTLTDVVITTTQAGGISAVEMQEVEVKATSGTFRLSQNGTTWTSDLAYNASALAVEIALETLCGCDLSVSQNSNVYLIEWKVNGNEAQLQADETNLGPTSPNELIDYTLQITAGTAKNKIRIIKSAVDNGDGTWTLTLDKPWLSPFTGDASVPDATSEYAIFVTNPNLLVTEETQADILWVSDVDNPGSYNDPALLPALNPRGMGEMFFESDRYGPKVRISTRTNGGVGGADEVQTLQLVDPQSGDFTLFFGAEQTGTIQYDATASQIQAALEALPSIAPGDVTVTLADETFVITFTGALAATDQPKLRANADNLVGGDPLEKMRITGFGMGGDRNIGGAPQPGGITFEEIDDLRIDLGQGSNQFTIEDTHVGKTTVNTGRGNDAVYVKTISGHTFVNLGAGNDEITVTSNASKLDQILGLLTVSGDTPRADVLTLAKGSAANVAAAINAVNEIQQVTIDATDGTYTLSLFDDTSDPIQWNATADEVEDALEALDGVEPGDVEVHKAGFVYRITFLGLLAGQDIPLLASNSSGLTNGAGATDTMTVDDTATTADTWALLTSSSLTGLALPGPNEIQQLVIDATDGTFTVSYGTATTGPLSWIIDAGDLQLAIEGLTGIGTGNVAVTKNDDVYVVRFQGSLSNTDVSPLSADPAGLVKDVEALGGAVVAGTPTATFSTRRQGGQTDAINSVQVLTVNATAGVYRLSFAGGTLLTTDIPFDASAEMLRQKIQDAIAMGNVFDALKFDVTVERYENVYLIGFQGNFRSLNDGPGIDFLVAHTTGVLTGTVSIQTRMDGINYYGLEVLNITTGFGEEVFNIQGTTPGSGGFAGAGGIAVTNVSVNDGDDRIFASSNADLDDVSWGAFQFLTGNLDDFNGALNLDLGDGRHRLFISDEGTSVGDTDVVITDANPSAPGLSAAEIWITGLAPRGISYTVASTGDLYDGVAYWTGSGADTITMIDGTHYRAGTERTTTLLNTGLGNDNVTVTLDLGEDDYLALFTSGGSATDDPLPIDDAAPDDDTVDASASTLPLVIIGGFGNDTLTGGSADDVIFGDLGRVQYAADVTSTEIIATHGFGGRGDVISSVIVDPRYVISRHLQLGASDVVQGNAGEDVLIGGAGSIGFPGIGDFHDYIDGDADSDLIFGDAVELERRDVDTTVVGGIAESIESDRFQTLAGTMIYGRADLDDTLIGTTSGAVLIAGGPRDYRDPAGAPHWAEYKVIALFHSFDIEDAGGNDFGNDYIAGGASHDLVFGQLGDDTIQGDGSIEGALSGTPVYAYRDADNELQINASDEPDNDGDGHDYIEGNGGDDTIFGNLGQDDIVGGSSSLFTLTSHDLRPDGADGDFIFGGSGTDSVPATSRNHLGDESDEGHAFDADVILGDNGNIYRLVGIDETPAAGFLFFNYDAEGYAGDLRIVARATELLDYTLGGQDYNAAGWLTDIGSADEIHGESGDDQIHGMRGNDVLYGDGQNDQLIGGYDADWISGGTGDDGILGDDGRIFVSRNSSDYGEPLYGIGAFTIAEIDQQISTPGNMQQAVINANGHLKYTADLTPEILDFGSIDLASPLVHTRPLFANDILYGGLGDDSMHGGAGDDAMSGAEAPETGYANNYNQDGSPAGTALRSDFDHPLNPGNALGYNPTSTLLAQYDPASPRGAIMLPGDLSWLLNFSAGDGESENFWTAEGAFYTTDGDDHLFGDLGHDWLVGGTGRDSLWGGWGDDLLNADDDLTSALTPDPNASYEDMAFGGAGRDVLIANTGGDRLIDWLGEWNSFLTPFSPFGMATVSRTVQPQLPEYLYALSKSQGADPTLAAQHDSDPLRNGEPFGEIGLTRMQDAAWEEQRGAPRDPQAGNSHGQRDVLRTSGTLRLDAAPAPSILGTAGFVELADPVQPTLAAPSITTSSVPVTLTGPVGSAATYTVSDGTTSITNTLTITGSNDTVSVDTTGLSDGTLTVTVVVHDILGNWETPGPAGVLKDTTSPSASAPGSLARNNDAGEGWATVSDDALGSASATDAGGIASIVRSGVPGGNRFAIGTTTITYTITDVAGNVTTVTQTVTVNLVGLYVSAPAVLPHAAEGTSTVIQLGTFGDSAPGSSWSVTVAWGDGTSSTFSVASQGALSAGHTYANSGSYNAVVTVRNGASVTDSASFAVTVDNVAPTVTIGFPAMEALYAVGQFVSVIANFTDPAAADRHTCTVDWGDSRPPTTGSVSYPRRGAPQCSATSNYVVAGQYTITVYVNDGGPNGIGAATVHIRVGSAVTLAAEVVKAGTGAALDSITLAGLVVEAREWWTVRLGADVRLQALDGLEVEIADLPDAILGLAFDNTIVLDSDAAGLGWSTGSAGGVDPLAVIVHELGHVLGFDHDDADAHPTMAPTVRAVGVAHEPRFAGTRIGGILPTRIAGPSGVALIAAGPAWKIAWRGKAWRLLPLFRLV